MTVAFRILGSAEIIDGGAATAIGSRKQRLLLAVLLSRANQVVATDQLIASVWRSAAPESAGSNLRIYVHRLRRLLGPDRIVRRPGGYQLVVRPDELDANVFAALAEQGHRALQAGDPAGAATHLDAALSLWRGDPFADLDDEPVLRDHAARLVEGRLSALEDRVDAYLALGRHTGLIAELTGLTETYPFRERFHAQLMVALYRSGRQADALAVYQRARDVLVAELGLNPGPELRRAQAAILRSDPDLDPAPPDSPQETVAPAQLPAEVRDFIGRAYQVRQLNEWLPDGGIVVVTGTAGVGKTALAIAWARRSAGRFPDGQLYLDLRGHGPDRPRDPLDALAQLLRGLGVPARRVPSALDEAAALYRSLLARRRVLVLLDNAAKAEQVRPLLPGGPACLALATSRNSLAGLVARDGARTLRVDVLSRDEAVRLLAGIVGAERVAAEPDAAAGLVDACARLPLALRIAATGLALRPDRSLGSHLRDLVNGDRLEQLQIEGDDTTAVRDAFTQSYAALDADTRRMFRLLGLAAGEALDVPAAAALVGITPESAARLLGRLAAAHLVDEHAPGRYLSHDLLRRYARERSDVDDDAGGRVAAVDRLDLYYLRHTEAAARLLTPELLRLSDGDDAPDSFPDARTALDWLETERANLVATVHNATASRRPVGWLLADALRGYFWLNRNVVDWLAVARAALAAAGACGDVRAEAAAQLSLALAEHAAGQGNHAIDSNAKALRLCRDAGWPEGEAAALGNLGLAMAYAGRLDEATAQFERALAINRRTGRRASEAVNLNNLGYICRYGGRLRDAQSYLTRALELHRETKTPASQVVTLTALGDVQRALGDIAAAEAHLDDALQLAQRSGNPDAEATARYSLAAHHAELGRPALAIDLAMSALAIAERRDDHFARAMAHSVAGRAHDDQGNHQRAADHHRAAARSAGAAGSDHLEVAIALGLAVTALREGNLVEAAERAGQARTASHHRGYRLLEADALTTLAETHLARDEPATAHTLADQALRLYREASHAFGMDRTRQVLARAGG